MTNKSKQIWLLTAFLLFGTLSLVTATKLNCDGDNDPVDCLLFQFYQELNDESACQLCAVAIELGKYPKKCDQFCNYPDGTVRKCEMISFTYLLTTQRFSEAFDLQYEIFYRDPFGHNQRVSPILKKQHIRSQIIAWLENIMDDQNPEAFLARAIANLYLDDINESDTQLEHYLALKGGIFDKQTIKLKCRILQKQGQFNEAFNIVNKYIQEGERDQHNYHMLEPYLYHLKGNLLMHHLKFKEAILEFTKSSNTFQAYYQEKQFLRGFKFSQFNIGLCYQKMSKHQEAITKYIDLVKDHVKTVEVLNALGNAFIELGIQQNPQKLDSENSKIQKAIFYLSRAIEVNPNYYLAHYNLGYAYMKSGQYNLAIQKFKDSLNIQKSSQTSYALLTTYFLLGDYQEAENFITKNIKVNKENIDDLLSVCYQYGNLKQNPKFYHKVLTQYQQFVKSANGHYWKAMIELDREQYGLAIDHFLQAYDKGYNEPHLLFNLAYAYELIYNHKSACNYYEKAYLKDPRSQTKQKIQQCKSKIKPQNSNQQNNQQL